MLLSAKASRLRSFPLSLLVAMSIVTVSIFSSTDKAREDPVVFKFLRSSDDVLH